MFKLFKKAPEPEETQPGEEQAVTQRETATGEALQATSETDESQQDSRQEPEPSADKSMPLTGCFDSWLKANVGDEAIQSAAIEAMGAVETALKDYSGNGAQPIVLFELIVKGADYARAVSEAESAGEIRGRNARIEEERELRFNDDGVPHPGAGCNRREVPLPSIFQVARGVY